MKTAIYATLFTLIVSCIVTRDTMMYGILATFIITAIAGRCLALDEEAYDERKRIRTHN